MLLNPRTPLVFGIAATAALAGYLFLRDPLPDALSHAHGQVIPDSDIHSCRRCHTDQGLTAGCLACHTEIAGQLDAKQGYHSFLAESGTRACAPCHPEHHGTEFPLVSVLSWPGGDPNAFDHPHCDYRLSGRHDSLACMECHQDKLGRTFSLAQFPDHRRTHTFLGLTQNCLACHVDVHAWPSEKACLECHDQTVFSPSSGFRHDKVFVLEGVHAGTDCAGCHAVPTADSKERSAAKETAGSLAFHKTTGKTCQQCHPDPHHTRWDMECQACHLGRDAQWREGTRGVSVDTHKPTGFPLTGGHLAVSCDKCHSADKECATRYPDPKAQGYQRRPQTCQGCHEDVHAGKLDHSCSVCHQDSGWKDGHLLFDHDRHTTFKLDAVHRGLSCQDCHASDDKTYRAEGSDCTACHKVQADALRGQARRLQVEPDPHADRLACIDCHDMNVPRQSMDNYARRCADCHNDQYAQLAYQWAQALQRRQAAIEQLMAARDGAWLEQIRKDLREAKESGFHNLHLTRQLYDRMTGVLQVTGNGTAASQEEQTP